MIVRDKEAYSGYADVSRTQSFGSAKWDDYAQYCLDRREAILEREAERQAHDGSELHAPD